MMILNSSPITVRWLVPSVDWRRLENGPPSNSDYNPSNFEILQYCHFTHIFGTSSSISERGALVYSKYFWPLIPHIFGLTVLITTNIWLAIHHFRRIALGAFTIRPVLI